MLPTVRLRSIDKQQPTEINKIVELAYGLFNVPFTRIFKTSEGYKAICRNEYDADKILNKSAQDELDKIGLQVIIPPEMKAKRSVIIKQLDQIIGTHSAEDIKEEIENQNDWIKVSEVVKMKNYTHLIKLRLEETSMVERAQRQGILAFNMAISPSQIETEEYVNVLTCYKCYQLEDHVTKDCPHKDLIICSECGDLGHSFRDCVNPVKSCINCNKKGNHNNHRTLAMACPLRKTIVNEKINEKRSRNAKTDGNTYAEIAKRAVAEAKHNVKATHINLSEQKHTKILISIMHAHVMNLCNPGSYQQELNKMLQQNELPTMWFPENPDSGKLLGASASQLVQDDPDMITEETDQESRTARQSNRDPRLAHRRTSLDSGTTHKARSHSQSRSRTSATGTPPKQGQTPQQANEIGLKIHITGKHIVPTMDPHMEFVVKQIKAGNFKWTYTDSRYEEDLIGHLISTQDIKITKNEFRRIDEGSFRKIRNGLDSRSPPEETRKAKK